MNDLVESALRLSDSPTVKKEATILSSTAYMMNQHLTPQSLETVEARELYAQFIKVALRHILSVRNAKQTVEIGSKAQRLKNKPIGGGLL